MSFDPGVAESRSKVGQPLAMTASTSRCPSSVMGIRRASGASRARARERTRRSLDLRDDDGELGPRDYGHLGLPRDGVLRQGLARDQLEVCFHR